MRAAAQDRYQPAYRLQAALEEARQRLGRADREDSARLATARATASLADRLRQLGGVDLIRALATASVPEPARAGRSLTTADAVVGVLKRFEWDRLEPLRRAAGGEGRPGGPGVRDRAGARGGRERRRAHPADRPSRAASGS
ncbi:hypothetical protein [Propioniciclava flava]